MAVSAVSLKSAWQKIPPSIRAFGKRALMLLVGWIILYNTLLKPYRIPDRWLSNLTAKATAAFMTQVYKPSGFMEKDGWACVTMNNRSIIRIGDPCNALDLFVLYLGFMLCIPRSKQRMLLFSIGGLVAIFAINVLRCAALAWMALQNHDWIEFAHKYVFTAIVYCCIFAGWVWYAKDHKLKSDL